MREERKQCEYEYTEYSWLLDRSRCILNAEPHSKYCILHQEVDGKELVGIRVKEGEDLTEGYLKRADLDHASVQRVHLDGAKLQGANLSFANLQGASLASANLQGAYLFGANLQGANLYRASLQGAYLGDADLRGAFLADASLRDVCLSRCRLDGSTLKNAKRPITVMERPHVRRDNGFAIQYARTLGDVAHDHRILKNYFRVEGCYDEVSEHYYRERMFIRKDLAKNRRVWPWITNMAYEVLCGYGEKPWRTVAFSILFVFLYFIIFLICGVSFDRALLSSLLSFTTLGYGAQMMASTPLQLLAGSEALLGTFMMALLAFTFARKVQR